MSELKDIRREVSKYIGQPVTVEKLKSEGGSKTVSYAKKLGVYIARQDGHDYDDIAKCFGYKTDKSVGNAFSAVSKNIEFDGVIQRDVKCVQESLDSIDPA